MPNIAVTGFTQAVVAIAHMSHGQTRLLIYSLVAFNEDPIPLTNPLIASFDHGSHEFHGNQRRSYAIVMNGAKRIHNSMVFLWALVMHPLDSGGICSMGPYVVHGKSPD